MTYYELKTPGQTHPTHELTKYKDGYSCRYCGAYAKSFRITIVCPIKIKANEVNLYPKSYEEKAPNRSPKP